MNTYTQILAIAAVLAVSTATAESGQAVRQISDQHIADVDNTSDWLAYGRNHNEQRFSPLQQINAGNLDKLSVDWYMDLPNDIGLVATPLVIDGVLYFTGSMNLVRAVDARTGKLIWEHDPQVAQEVAGHKKAGWVHNRGLSAYGDKIFAATWDGRLQALNRVTGELVWSTRTFELSEALYITGAPKAFKGKVLIGNGGTEHGPSRGYVSAYDAQTGKLAWRFYIVPGNPAEGFEDEAMEMAAATWSGQWWEHGGGGNAWHAFTYDEELDQLYIGTGNGSPWNQKLRSPAGGDNLFLCSVVALDPDTGKYLWHYQTVPGETWDYNSNMDIVLADLKVAGRDVKAMMHAPKNGFFYVIDRRDGKLLSAEKFADVNWASHVDLDTGRPVERAGARYEDGFENIYPSPFGAHSWHAMSYNPGTGLVYLPTIHMSADFKDEAYDEAWRSVSFEGGAAVDWAKGPDPRAYSGELQAWDPIAQRQVWAKEQSSTWASGTLTTGSNLVFQGEADGMLHAYDARNGKALWSYDAGLGISAPPITYELDGKQYLSVLVGFGGGFASRLTPGSDDLGWAYGVQMRRLLTFSLDGKADVPAQPAPHFPQPLVEADFKINDQLAAAGAVLYLQKTCYSCHGIDVVAGGMAPDLRASAIPLSEMEPFFSRIVRDGERLGRGMPGFPDLTDEELEALRHYIRRTAHAAAEIETGSP